MRVLVPATLGAVLLLAGCTAPPSPEPLTLHYPYGSAGTAPFAGAEEIVERAAGAYVRVVIFGANEDEGGPATGVVSGASGVIVDLRGHIVTAAHIARHTRFRVKVTTLDGAWRPGRILQVDPRRELALIKIEPFPDMKPARIVESRSLQPGQKVFNIGTPENREGAVSFGEIITPRLRRRIEYGDFGFDDAIELAMEAGPGHSGGPLFDRNGDLVGLLASFGLGDTRQVPYVSTRVAYAVPSKDIQAYLEEAACPYLPPSTINAL